MFVNVLFLDRKSSDIFHNIHSIFPTVVEFHLNHVGVAVPKLSKYQMMYVQILSS